MRKNACEAILADRPDRGDRIDPRAAAEVEALRADNARKDAEIEALRADNARKDAEIEALKRANAHDGGPHAPPPRTTPCRERPKSRAKRG